MTASPRGSAFETGAAAHRWVHDIVDISSELGLVLCSPLSEFASGPFAYYSRSGRVGRSHRPTARAEEFYQGQPKFTPLPAYDEHIRGPLWIVRHRERCRLDSDL